MSDIVSVIVPVYKVEEYLEKCILSIQEQTYSDLEIILVDDGSPDNCPAICDKLALSDKRIKVIHKKNEGLSEARNSGLDIATGKYIFFVDSDDSIALNTIEFLIKKLIETHSDISITTMQMKNNTNLVIYGESKQVLVELISHIGTWSAWGKIFKSEVLNGFRFPKGLIYEDYYSIANLMLNAERAVIIDNGMYYYTIRSDSIIGSTKNNVKPDLIIGCRNNLHQISKVENLVQEKLFAYFIMHPIKSAFSSNRKLAVSKEYLRDLKSLIDDYHEMIMANRYIDKVNKLKIKVLSVILTLFKLYR